MRERFARENALDSLERIDPLELCRNRERYKPRSERDCRARPRKPPHRPEAVRPPQPPPAASRDAIAETVSALQATAPKSGAIASVVTPPAANERFAANSLERATLPSRRAFAMRCGVASNGFSETSLTCSSGSLGNREQWCRRVLGSDRHRDNRRHERGGKRERKGQREAAEARNYARNRAHRDLHDECAGRPPERLLAAPLRRSLRQRSRPKRSIRSRATASRQECARSSARSRAERADPRRRERSRR